MPKIKGARMQPLCCPPPLKTYILYYFMPLCMLLIDERHLLANIEEKVKPSPIFLMFLGLDGWCRSF